MNTHLSKTNLWFFVKNAVSLFLITCVTSNVYTMQKNNFYLIPKFKTPIQKSNIICQLPSEKDVLDAMECINQEPVKADFCKNTDLAKRLGGQKMSPVEIFNTINGALDTYEQSWDDKRPINGSVREQEQYALDVQMLKSTLRCFHQRPMIENIIDRCDCKGDNKKSVSISRVLQDIGL